MELKMRIMTKIYLINYMRSLNYYAGEKIERIALSNKNLIRFGKIADN